MAASITEDGAFDLPRPPPGSPRHRRQRSAKSSRLRTVERYITTSRWKLATGPVANGLGSGSNSLRIYQEVRDAFIYIPGSYRF